MANRSRLFDVERGIFGLVHTHAELVANIEEKRARLESMGEVAF